ncbi:tRNA glutamyl-Q(34) synthetase GluQRS [Shewanella sp. OMA3-2]|uniref:tRNA glutamyl-Q(34) synthetase GluQRS n=1 Tax=Shewanella sp. OMA3-2 TaxID=2908650 RepID=UPI001F172DC2|nr:tRNA glutamyl-Q(34) synthetase GluQRS [Shewanella sp. OMA3-2]UJF21733.1 tRNA glutamyl-Q(34) synthetase GluQRS [Shewanella sp. OMA3-2]
MSYIGRFAPSPSGSLHFGSLIAALGSYLRAHSLHGQWLVRMEDIDPPREVHGASDDILRTLDAYGLHWHGSVLYQSQRTQVYQSTIEQLLAQNQAYYCQCSRKMIQTMGGVYDSRCGLANIKTTHFSGAIRIRNSAKVSFFEDINRGRISVESGFAGEDFIIKRSDGLFAYQLAVVIDDAFQGITEVVRGSDLLHASCRQVSLFNLLNLPSPNWLHLPLACAKPGFKLSKQNHAPAINIQAPQQSLNAALDFLGQAKVDIDHVDKMLAQAVAQFSLASVPKHSEIILAKPAAAID